MPDPSPPRPSLATLLRQPERPAPEQADAAAPADAEPGAAASPAQARGAGAAPHADAVPTPAQAAPATSSPDTDAPLAATAHSPPLASEADVSIASRAGASESELASEAALEPGPAPQASAASAAAATPSFMQRRAPRRPVLRAAPWQWIALTGLGLLLALQILIADRQRLGADARWRPWVAGVCQVLRCSLPPWREPGAFTMLSREVRPLPGRAGTLQIQATFRNDARWAQAWPLLQLSLADADGRTIGSRVLRPQDYLGRTRHEAATLAPGQSAQVTFQVREPAAETAAFSFDFH
ncbi:DUF3426 domain-containing protein [Xanthomonas graminis]|uniref:DUF3426 domain-containing protein n=1 Tax=Xanthomonas graminis pv. phlei TaxID=487906 RepID=A0A0K3A9X3_9XANT|nr:DUF3426 domain-containing protein [Xanthomonas translucens]CTP92310.1 hypothetical protein XTPLMG730_3449 [Xanthomonas translucens pv. phlei]